MPLSKTVVLTLLRDWLVAWCQHDLDSVLELMHEDIEFQSWTGSIIKSKRMLRKAWGPWFRDHGDFLFTEEDIFFDEREQIALLSWSLDWPTQEKKLLGQRETRRGVDILYFVDGKIHKKCSYTKTTIQINGRIILK
jgi:ketosteroid isomerase-like protein